MKTDWVYAWRIHHNSPVALPEDQGERIQVANELIDVYGWSIERAAEAVRVHYRQFFARGVAA